MYCVRSLAGIYGDLYGIQNPFPGFAIHFSLHREVVLNYEHVGCRTGLGKLHRS
jgi:hypothetical protein